MWTFFMEDRRNITLQSEFSWIEVSSLKPLMRKYTGLVGYVRAADSIEQATKDGNTILSDVSTKKMPGDVGAY